MITKFNNSSLSLRLLLIVIVFDYKFSILDATNQSATKSHSTSATKQPPNTKFNLDQCFQHRRYKKGSDYGNEIEKNCQKIMINNFCDHVQCLKIDKCPDGYELIDNIVGNNCCPSCVKLLDENEDCTPESMGMKNELCKNGLICNHSTRKCQLPDSEHINVKYPCLFDYHNRFTVRNDRYFFVQSANTEGIVYFPIQYAKEQYLPSCTFDGNYRSKQPTQNKAYCVNPNDGRSTFGISDSHRSVNQTCKCSQSMQDKLSLAIDRLNPNIDKKLELDRVIMEFYSDTHMKCKFSGNFQPVQCINETCLCVNERNGQPILDPKFVYNKDWAIKQNKILYEPLQPQFVRWQSAVSHGALNRLVCFDEEEQKKKLTPDKTLEKTYSEDCYIETSRSSRILNHFHRKGTTLDGLSNTKCGFDDNYYRVQCPDATCTCHAPNGDRIGTYGVDSKRSQDIDCRCALEEYLSTHGLPVGILRCEAMGNFVAMQCTQNGQICYCVDDNGARISERFLIEKFHDFKLKTSSGNYYAEDICVFMRETLSLRNNYLINNDQHFCYNPAKKQYHLCSKPNDNDIFD